MSTADNDADALLQHMLRHGYAMGHITSSSPAHHLQYHIEGQDISRELMRRDPEFLALQIDAQARISSPYAALPEAPHATRGASRQTYVPVDMVNHEMLSYVDSKGGLKYFLNGYSPEALLRIAYQCGIPIADPNQNRYVLIDNFVDAMADADPSPSWQESLGLPRPARSNPMKCRSIRIPADGCEHCHCAHCNKHLPAGSRAYGITPDAASLPAGVSPAQDPVVPVCSLGCAAAYSGAAHDDSQPRSNPRSWEDASEEELAAAAFGRQPAPAPRQVTPPATRQQPVAAQPVQRQQSTQAAIPKEIYDLMRVLGKTPSQMFVKQVGMTDRLQQVIADLAHVQTAADGVAILSRSPRITKAEIMFISKALAANGTIASTPWFYHIDNMDRDYMVRTLAHVCTPAYKAERAAKDAEDARQRAIWEAKAKKEQAEYDGWKSLWLRQHPVREFPAEYPQPIRWAISYEGGGFGSVTARSREEAYDKAQRESDRSRVQNVREDRDGSIVQSWSDLMR